MADAVSELLVTEAAIDKLGSRGITIEESHQLPRNVHVTIRNPHHGPSGQRRLLIGRTDGGRSLTLVIEQNERSDHMADHHRLGRHPRRA